MKILRWQDALNPINPTSSPTTFPNLHTLILPSTALKRVLAFGWDFPQLRSLGFVRCFAGTLVSIDTRTIKSHAPELPYSQRSSRLFEHRKGALARWISQTRGLPIRYRPEWFEAAARGFSPSLQEIQVNFALYTSYYEELTSPVLTVLGNRAIFPDVERVYLLQVRRRDDANSLALEWAGKMRATGVVLEVTWGPLLEVTRPVRLIAP